MRELTLILNTAEKRVQFALCENGSLLCAQDWLAQRGGTELLAPALREACSRLGVTPAAIRRIACVAGPGNFTGLRIGLTTAAGLARALNAKQAGLSYLQCLAANAPARRGETTLVLTNARKGLAYGARFTADEHGVPQPEGRIFLLPLPPLPEGTDLGAPDFVVGSALVSNLDCLKAALPETSRLLVNASSPPPAWNASSTGTRRTARTSPPSTCATAMPWRISTPLPERRAVLPPSRMRSSNASPTRPSPKTANSPQASRNTPFLFRQAHARRFSDPPFPEGLWSVPFRTPQRPRSLFCARRNAGASAPRGERLAAPRWKYVRAEPLCRASLWCFIIFFT